MQEGGKSILAILADGIGAALWRTGPGDGQRGRQGERRFFWSIQSVISLMKWGSVMKPTGPEATDILSTLPEIAIHGNFTLGYSTIS